MNLPPLPFTNTFSFIFFPFLLLFPSIATGSSSIQYDPQQPIAVNCGLSSNSTAFNGRQWVGETESASIILHGPGSKSVSHFSVDRSNSLDPSPYKTARASWSSFTYTFHVGSGYKFIRLHFYPTTYNGFKKSNAFLTVKSGPYTLLNNFSALLTVGALGLKFIVKEFTLYVPDNEPLSITFSPSRGNCQGPKNPSDETFAFVNGIEVVPMPLGLYYTMEGDEGVYVLGQNYRLPISKATAMETAYRLNVGGGSLPSAHETSMFREWTDDSNHLIQSNVLSITSSNKIKYKKTSKDSAPQRVYQTSWSMNQNTRVGKEVNFSWKLPVDMGFRYLIRLHFCELDYEMKEIGQKEFSIRINNQVVEPRGDLIRWGGEIGVAIHKDYMETVRGDKMMGKKDLILSLYPGNLDQSIEFIDAVLKGIEVFKLTNPDDNLAGVNPVVSHSRAPVKGILKMLITTGRNKIATLVIILATLLNVIVYQICEWKGKGSSISISPSLPNEELCRRFSFSEILFATKNFDKGLEIGHGGFGKVYKGVIQANMKTVAIKRLSSESKQGEKEFRSEIEILSKHRHKHLVSLIGYCNEGREMILVYEYMENGTLADHLHKNKLDGCNNGGMSPLSWEQRLNICLGAARGLDYLHTNTEQDTIHRDVKSENILIDLNWVAKIADFGICKVETMSNTRTHISTDIKGTIGYLDPEYFLTRRLTKKSDVYAFGVVLWEVLCGRPAIDTRTDGEQRSLVLWVQGCFSKGTVDTVIDSSLSGQISTRSLKLYLELANLCLHNQIKERPTMAEVTHGIESVLDAALSQDEEEVTNVNDFGSHREYSDSTDEIDLNSSTVQLNSVSSTSSGPLQLDDTNMYQYKKKSKFGKIFKALVRSIDIRRRKSNDNSSTMELEPHLENVLLPFRRFSLAEVRTATNNFNNVIGLGGFGKSYKGIIDDGTTLVAIKETNLELRHRKNALLIMSQINHRNIVKFIGYCNDDGKMWFLLEYIDNGSLSDHLHNRHKKNHLPWKKRLQICMGVAHALHYLHNEMTQIVIHRNMKSTNILLDRNFVTKVSGLDLTLTTFNPNTHITTMKHGTMGYLDPEFYMTGQHTVRSDVYSFGVVLLEVLCAKKSVDSFDNDDLFDDEDVFGRQHIVQYIRSIIRANRIDMALDPYLVGRIAPDCLIQYLQMAMNCVKDRGIERPSMEEVLSGLRNMLRIQESWQFDASLDPPLGATVSSMDSAADEWFRMATGRAYNNIIHYGSEGIQISESRGYLPFSRNDLTDLSSNSSVTDSL